mmetsp:Transcript_2315/g.3711  ORF Transcript_2315/g.3711 Transcript_2315/m.3711 type:complete len:251 (+) Transcript_2315:845-1597(+)
MSPRSSRRRPQPRLSSRSAGRRPLPLGRPTPTRKHRTFSWASSTSRGGPRRRVAPATRSSRWSTRLSPSPSRRSRTSTSKPSSAQCSSTGPTGHTPAKARMSRCPCPRMTSPRRPTSVTQAPYLTRRRLATLQIPPCPCEACPKTPSASWKARARSRRAWPCHVRSSRPSRWAMTGRHRRTGGSSTRLRRRREPTRRSHCRPATLCSERSPEPCAPQPARDVRFLSALPPSGTAQGRKCDLADLARQSIQ